MVSKQMLKESKSLLKKLVNVTLASDFDKEINLEKNKDIKKLIKRWSELKDK
jgi:hypothetical protein